MTPTKPYLPTAHACADGGITLHSIVRIGKRRTASIPWQWRQRMLRATRADNPGLNRMLRQLGEELLERPEREILPRGKTTFSAWLRSEFEAHVKALQ